MRSSRPASSNPLSTPQLFTSRPCVPATVSGFFWGPQRTTIAARALIPFPYYLSPEDPLLPASLSFLRPSFPLQHFRKASPLGKGTAPSSAGLQHAAARGDPAPGDPFSCLYPTVAGSWFSGHLQPHPPCLSSLPLLEVSGAVGESLASPSPSAEVWRFLNQTCISSSTGTLSFYLLPLA